MKNEMRKFLTILPVIGLVLCVSACREEPEPGVEPGTNSGDDLKSVVFSVGGSDTETKSGRSIRRTVTDMIPVPAEPGEDALFLEESVISLDDVYNYEGAETKGIPTFTKNFATIYGTFGADVYDFTDGDLSKNIKTNGSLKHVENTASPLKYEYDFGGTSRWTEASQKLMFFMRAPASPAGITAGPNYSLTTAEDKDGGVITFTYKSPATAATQEDLLFTSKMLTRDAYVKELNSGKPNNSVLFYHTLAGVKFQCGNTVLDKNDKPIKDSYVTMKSIVIENIYNKGVCTVTPMYESDGYICGDSNISGKTDKSSVVSTWDKRSIDGTSQYTLSSDATTGIGINTGVDSQFPDEFVGDALNAANFNTNTFSNTFFFVPQTTPTDAKVTITYMISYVDKITGRTETAEHTKSIAFNGRTWKAGELYTYKLTVRELGVYIKDVMNDNRDTKSNVQITNTLNTNEYIRVAVIGNWFDSHEIKNSKVDPSHVIVDESWTSDIAFNEACWKKIGDFWYYKYPVKGGVTIPAVRAIFDTYSYDLKKPAKVGSHLEMTLAVQAIDAAKWGQTDWPWPSKNDDWFSTTVDDGSNTTSTTL